MRRKTLCNELIAATVALLFLLAVTPATHADPNCSDATACGDALDEANPGDNQVGDSGADRDRPDGKQS